MSTRNLGIIRLNEVKKDLWNPIILIKKHTKLYNEPQQRLDCMVLPFGIIITIKK